MTILKYCSIGGNKYYLADTPERLEAAQRIVFQKLDDQGIFENVINRQNGDLYRAQAGNIQAIRRLMTNAEGIEIEGWYTIEVIDPCTN